MRSPARPIQKGSHPGRNWKAINQDSAAIADLQRKVGVQPIQPGQRSPFVLKRKPFEVYNTPNVLRPLEERDTDTAWRTFQVRHGYVNNVKCYGCDDADGEDTTPEEIEVLPDVAAYYVWLEISLDGNGDVDTVTIAHGQLVAGVLTLEGGAPANWTNFPKRSIDNTKVFITLAKIDTDTYSARKRPVVRQFVRDDIFLAATGGGGLDQWSP